MSEEEKPEKLPVAHGVRRPIPGIGAWAIDDADDAPAIEEVEYLSDRAAAIIGGTILENSVTIALCHEFIDDKVNIEKLIGRGGPLNTFETKAKLLRVLGLLSENGYKDLANIITIRNRFAHKIKASSFQHDQIKNLCMNLKIVESLVMERQPLADAMFAKKMPRFSLFVENPSEVLSDARNRFFLAIAVYSRSFRVRRTVRNFPTEYF